tara:strand:+ start:531 stop:1148 length:618 start_codon:yes stop_codon:yes gene_type:complete
MARLIIERADLLNNDIEWFRNNSEILYEFERADLKNDIEWFEKNYEMNKGKLNKHFQMTYGVFEWTNFIKWRDTVRDAYVQTASKVEINEKLGIVWNNVDSYYKTFEDEKIAVLNFVKNNPYPSYAKLSKLLPTKELSEYGEKQHSICKVIYENITTKSDTIKYFGILEKLYGVNTCQKCFYVLCNWSPLRANGITKSFAQISWR